MELQFIENIERDIRNWQKSVAANSYGVDWKKFLPEDISIENVRDNEYLKNYLERKYYQPGKVSEFKDWLEQNVSSSQIQADLEILMDKKFPPGNIKVFITTFHRAPYNVKRSFFYLIWRDSKKGKEITGIYHELMHFLFHIYYWDMCKKAGLSDTQIHILKESSTVLLNPILEKRGLPIDSGYAKHQEIRAKLKKLWDKENNFESSLLKAINLEITE
jgi:hypothetical protein